MGGVTTVPVSYCANKPKIKQNFECVWCAISDISPGEKNVKVKDKLGGQNEEKSKQKQNVEWVWCAIGDISPGIHGTRAWNT